VIQSTVSWENWPCRQPSLVVSPASSNRLLSSVINSLYSFYWDIKRDWDLRYGIFALSLFFCNMWSHILNCCQWSYSTTCSILTRIFMFKNPSTWTSLLYGQELGMTVNIWVSLSLLPWHLSLIPVLALQVYYWVLGSNLILWCTWTYKLLAHLRHNYLTVFTIMALEIMRRFQWVFFRVENEWNKMTSKQNLEMSSDIPSEGDRLLDSSSHTVWTAVSVFCNTNSSSFF
jgi:hypothetical protein